MNSTELELVRVGVDFVFQCHKKKNKKNKKNKKKNPHLILIYRKGLQVYNLGRLTVWVYRSCLESVWKMSGSCLEIVWKVFGRYLEGVRKVFRRCLEPYLLGRVTVWVYRSCLEDVWKVYGRCLEIVWKVFRRCLEPYLSYPYQPNYLCCFPIETKFHSNFSISESSTIWGVYFFFIRTSNHGLRLSCS